MNFTDFNLHETLMQGIMKAGYETCTPVQEQVLTEGLSGADLYVQSQTGTGKTAAYLILLIQQMLSKPELIGKKALIMVPTRELAVQVEEEARILTSGTTLKTCSFYGGVGYERQTNMLKKEVDILVGTPGRVIDLEQSGTMKLSEVAFLVVDEADRMFDMGFYPDLRTLITVLPATKERQTMLFSATLNTYVKNLAWEYTEDAKEINIEPEHITIEEIDQVLLHVSSDDKIKLLLGILKNEKPESIIVFCNTKRSCEVIAKRLKINGIEAEYIIGDLPQSKRLQVLESFKRGSLSCLVATDVAARGIDVNDLSMVINYDLPNEAENYIHRIGRTARAGKSGKAYTFCSEQDVYSLPAIERYIGKEIPASIASDDMFTQDASAGMYIKTERYDEDYNDRNHGRRNDRYSSDSRNNYGRSANPRGNRTDRPGSRYKKDIKLNDNRQRFTNEKKSQYRDEKRSGKPVYNRSKERESMNEDLSTLSFDERMKIYREKYGANSTANSENTTKPEISRSRQKKINSSRNPKKNKKQIEPKFAKHPGAPSGTTLSKPDNTVNKKVPVKNSQPDKQKTTKKGSAGILGIIQKFFGSKKK